MFASFDQLVDLGWWTSELTLKLAVTIAFSVLVFLLKGMRRRFAAYWATRNKPKKDIFNEEVSKLAANPMRFQLTAARQGSFQSAVVVYQLLGMILLLDAHRESLLVIAMMEIVSLLVYLFSVFVQFRADVMLAQMRAAIDRSEQKQVTASLPATQIDQLHNLESH